ncbi:hypothetical protein [Viridibacillus arvi]|uniref:hypothetical protein n=1 Tax=Viridibacillus arvi TaxID=263475 RepID=UPI003D2BBD37
MKTLRTKPNLEEIIDTSIYDLLLSDINRINPTTSNRAEFKSNCSELIIYLYFYTADLLSRLQDVQGKNNVSNTFTINLLKERISDVGEQDTDVSPELLLTFVKDIYSIEENLQDGTPYIFINNVFHILKPNLHLLFDINTR